MSDVPQGPGWWQASDDKWYPPPRPTMPGEEAAVAAGSAPPEGMAPPMNVPSGQGFGPPMGAPPGAPMAPGAPPGPYGAYPPGPPPGGGQNRTPLFIALGVVAVVALLGVGLAVASSGGDDDDPTPTSQASTTTPPDDTSSPTSPPETDGTDDTSGGAGAEDIEVVEKGFTNFDPEYEDGNHVSYGYVLENTGDDPVANLEITVTLLDSEGTVVSSDTDNVYLIQPGQKMGLGDEPYENIAEVAEIDVQASVPSYASDAEELGEITTEGIATSDESSQWKTTFTAKSTYEVQIDSPYAYVIYRNSGGDIVGGSYGFMNVLRAGGSTSGEVTSYEPIPGVDPAKTEVYVDPAYMF